MISSSSTCMFAVHWLKLVNYQCYERITDSLLNYAKFTYVDVRSQVSLLSEGGRTELTHVWTFTRVFGHVNLQGTLLVERLWTHGALERPLAWNTAQSNSFSERTVLSNSRSPKLNGNKEKYCTYQRATSTIFLFINGAYHENS